MTDRTDSVDDRLTSFLMERSAEDDEKIALYTQVVLVASYLDEDGEERWQAHTQGNGRTTNAVGLLEYAKQWLIQGMIDESGGWD